jgi:hypothetical protein
MVEEREEFALTQENILQDKLRDLPGNMPLN